MIRKRGKYHHFEIWLGGERRDYGSFNGKDGLPLAETRGEFVFQNECTGLASTISRPASRAPATRPAS